MKCPYCGNEMRRGRIKAVSHKDTDWRLGKNLGYAFFEEERLLAALRDNLMNDTAAGAADGMPSEGADKAAKKQSDWIKSAEIEGCHFCPGCNKVIIDLAE